MVDTLIALAVLILWLVFALVVWPTIERRK